MKAFLLSALLSAAVLSLAATTWLLVALALSRIRGWQVRRLLRRMEGREFPPRRPRVRLPVDFRTNGHKLTWTVGRKAMR